MQMTPIFLNSSSNHYWPTDLHHQDDHFSHSNQEFLSPNSQASSSSNSLTTHMFLNSTVVHRENGVSDTELQPLQPQHEDDNFGSQVYEDDRIENNYEKNHEFPTWNKSEMNDMINKDQNQMKWMSSKMRVMLKMKKSDPVNPNAYRSTTREATTLEDQKLPNSPIDQETENSSNSTTSNNSVPIRVCSDCNTTKTPLWRSGPRGPKSLCNACGIRQRKARRALAAAAAASAENGNDEKEAAILLMALSCGYAHEI
ncbi:Zinc finger, GATA-type [Cynara cardunculus var. scolymus]|uniref:Zinc finger, GATA-type n=1 Tax=Cynara cardunculus var. scolymus TaxID=59895 RepID=A0A103XNA4_CYNCS|nr:Zinc finger, GATA-type [Cynara cardunculus var. scolymus]